MDTTVIQSQTKSGSILLIDSDEYILFINKKSLIQLIKKYSKEDKSFIKPLQASDTIRYETFNRFSKNVIIRCIEEGQFTQITDRAGNTYTTILKVDNKHGYLEFILPDKKTSVLKETSHLLPKGKS
jgi:hypothetical protein